MTKRLILMRHAKSDWTHGLDDHKRPLNERGWQAAKLIGNWMKLNDYLPDQVLCSTAERTRETFDRLRIDAPISYVSSLYLAEPATMLEVLQGASGDCVLMVGHNPGTSLFAEAMTATPPDHPRFPDFPTCGTLVLDFDIDEWSQASPGSGAAVGFIVPRELVD